MDGENRALAAQRAGPSALRLDRSITIDKVTEIYWMGRSSVGQCVLVCVFVCVCVCDGEAG